MERPGFVGVSPFPFPHPGISEQHEEVGCAQPASALALALSGAGLMTEGILGTWEVALREESYYLSMLLSGETAVCVSDFWAGPCSDSPFLGGSHLDCVSALDWQR